jgi:hypothetical protein
VGFQLRIFISKQEFLEALFMLPCERTVMSFDRKNQFLLIGGGKVMARPETNLPMAGAFPKAN